MLCRNALCKTMSCRWGYAVRLYPVFFFHTVQVEITVRVSSHNYFYWPKIIDELTDWKHFQDAKFRQILKFDSVVVEGGGGKYVHTVHSTLHLVGLRLMQVLASSILSSMRIKTTPNARPCIPVYCTRMLHANLNTQQLSVQQFFSF